MTEIPPKPNNYQNTPYPKKLPKYSINLKNDWNTSKTYKKTEIPPKPKKITKIPWNLKNYRNTPKTFKKMIKTTPKPKKNDR